MEAPGHVPSVPSPKSGTGQNIKCVHIHNWTRTLFIGGMG